MRTRCLLAILLCLPLGAQENSYLTVLPPKPRPLGFLTRNYQQRYVPPVNLTNSGRLAMLIRSNNLYLTAQDVIALVLENNLDIEIQRYGPLLAQEDIMRARVGGALRAPSTPVAAGPVSVSTTGINVGAISQAAGSGVNSAGNITGQLGSLVPNLDPVLSFNASFGHFTYPESNLIVDQTNYLVQGSQSFSASYNQQFMPGTAVQLYFGSGRTTVNSPTTLLSPVTQGQLSLTVSQNLLQSFGASVNSRYITIARNNAKVTDLQLKQQVITTVSAVLNLYWDLVAFNEDVRLKQLALEAAEKLYADNREQLAAGAIAAIEVTRAQAEIPARRQDVLISQTNLLQQEIVLKNALSKRGIEDPLLAEVHIVPLDSIQVPKAGVLPPVKELIAQAMAQRPDLQQTRINIESQGLLIKGDRSALKPSLQAFASFTNHAQIGVLNPLNVGFLYGQPDPFYIGGYGSFLGQLFRRNFPDYSAGFNLTIPIRNRAAQADYAIDQLSLRQLQLQLEKSVNSVGVDVRNAMIGLQQAQARYETAVETRKLAEDTLKAEQKKNEYGKSTSALVILAQRDVVTSESEEVQSMANYTHARIAFEEALGVTLERNNITMREAEAGRVERQSSLPDVLPASKGGAQ
ncbi:MAG TPA: TolC family protein [Candidatus Limnocylindrales bacterium]|nr:TolC family protein [Candidatus Limnocylindrales bacterium]